MMRYFNEYQVKVIADDGSGESNATRSEIIRFNVKNVPDYEVMILQIKFLLQGHVG